MTYLIHHEQNLLRLLQQQAHDTLKIKAPQQDEFGQYVVTVTQPGQAIDDLHELQVGPQRTAAEAAELRREIVAFLTQLPAPSGTKTVYTAELKIDLQAPLSGYQMSEQRGTVPSSTVIQPRCSASLDGQTLTAQSVISAAHAQQYLSEYRKTRRQQLLRPSSPWRRYFLDANAHWIEINSTTPGLNGHALLLSDPALTRLYLWVEDGETAKLLSHAADQGGNLWSCGDEEHEISLLRPCAAHLPVIFCQPREHSLAKQRRPRQPRQQQADRRMNAF